MAMLASAAAVAAVTTVTSAALVRLQKKHIKALEDKVSGLQQKATQFEDVPKLMSQKRRETVEATQRHIGKLETKTEEREEQIQLLLEQVENLTATVLRLQDQAPHLESAPTVPSVKRRQAEEVTRTGEASLETRCPTKDEQLGDLHKNVRCMLERLRAFEQRLLVLEGNGKTPTCLPGGARRRSALKAAAA